MEEEQKAMTGVPWSMSILPVLPTRSQLHLRMVCWRVSWMQCSGVSKTPSWPPQSACESFASQSSVISQHLDNMPKLTYSHFHVMLYFPDLCPLTQLPVFIFALLMSASQFTFLPIFLSSVNQATIPLIPSLRSQHWTLSHITDYTLTTRKRSSYA